MKIIITLILLSVFCVQTQASLGNRLPQFVSCRKQCMDQTCQDPPIFNYHESYKPTEFEEPSNFWLRFFQWDCTSNCDYLCQRLVTRERKLNHLSVLQFNGKWPFKRVLGMQEFFSVLFSAGNLIVNYRSFKLMGKNCRKFIRIGGDKEIIFMYQNYSFLILVSIIGWGFSMLFHIRDNNITETLDYFGAAAIIMAQFYTISLRYFNLFQQKSKTKYFVFSLILLIVYINHTRILLANWDYDYNVKFNLAFGLLSNLFWILHCLNVKQVTRSTTYSKSLTILQVETNLMKKLNSFPFIGPKLSSSKLIPYVPIMLNLWIMCGMSLELFDFPPWFDLIDAHSLWHLATIYPPYIWYDWNIWDLETLKL